MKIILIYNVYQFSEKISFCLFNSNTVLINNLKSIQMFRTDMWRKIRFFWIIHSMNKSLWIVLKWILITIETLYKSFAFDVIFISHSSKGVIVFCQTIIYNQNSLQSIWFLQIIRGFGINWIIISFLNTFSYLSFQIQIQSIYEMHRKTLEKYFMFFFK